MHLEDVTIVGFKSFSEPTHMSFQPGINVIIIGNNGVGKSNILDAIVWAMGEEDLARMRCREAGELFFSGSRAFSPASLIAVELEFKEGVQSGAQKVRIRRERAKDGRETYKVQDQSIGREGYQEALKLLKAHDALKTIIRQEQINDIVALEPPGRLLWIQELMGCKGLDDATKRLEKEVAPKFQEFFRYLFPQGEGRLDLVPCNGSLGLEVQVTLLGNRVRKAHQLSGGERSVTSLALKLAAFEQLDSPFFLLDEVEPSLDYTNHKSMQSLLKALAQKRQLVMITHLRSTIELANTVHGVRTRWDGSSFMKFYFVMDERLLRLYKCC